MTITRSPAAPAARLALQLPVRHTTRLVIRRLLAIVYKRTIRVEPTRDSLHHAPWRTSCKKKFCHFSVHLNVSENRTWLGRIRNLNGLGKKYWLGSWPGPLWSRAPLCDGGFCTHGSFATGLIGYFRMMDAALAGHSDSYSYQTFSF